ncbi:hypothetical protein QYE76_010021 [Lolium multiflorum]|uniref:Uncharacterized protein n=1 Tax=Lolium multiflorum TaxID=4521 RepID=A0AAD8TWE8_LOLMU|nr:hypothetical protein QYE76_010021 [Lolium multiflorum]
MAESSNADTMVSGLKVSDILLPHPSLPNSMCLGPRSSESPAHLISCEANRIPFVNQHLDLTSWADCLRAWPNPPEGWVPCHRCYTFFDALALPIPHNLRFSSTTDGFETWWSMWKTHVFRRALGPQLKQLDAAHDISADQINETSSGVVEEVPMPSTAPGPSNSPRVTDHSGAILRACDIRPDSIEPAAPKIGEEPNLGAVDGPLQRLKVLLSSPVDALVEDPETIRGILVDIQPRLPVVLVAKLWNFVGFKSRVQSARQRITLRRAQLPLRADIAEKCQRLNEKKAALDAKTATSTHSARLETLRKELEDLERRARETKQLIQDEESLIARSQEEAQGLTADRRPT